jgi:hypothetical protein
MNWGFIYQNMEFFSVSLLHSEHPMQSYPGYKVRLPEREPANPTPSSAILRSTLIYAFTPPYVFMMWWLIRG